MIWIFLFLNTRILRNYEIPVPFPARPAFGPGNRGLFSGMAICKRNPGAMGQDGNKAGQMRNRGWNQWRGAKVVNGKVVQGQDNAPSKFHNIPCEADGIKFQSKRERDYYTQNLLPRYKRGEVKWFLLQVPFRLTGGVVYRADFLEILQDGKIRVVDVKGHRTQVYRNKKKQVEALYPVRIIET